MYKNTLITGIKILRLVLKLMSGLQYFGSTTKKCENGLKKLDRVCNAMYL